MTRPAQVSDDSWATEKPMGVLGRTHIPKKKVIKGQNNKNPSRQAV